MDIANLAKSVSSQLQLNTRVTLESLQELIDNNTRTHNYDLSKYTKFSCNNYQRNLVYRDKIIEVFILCWRRGQTTPYHLHPNRGCVYKIISGTLKEKIKHGDDTCSRVLRKGDCGYIDNQIGSHQMECVSEEVISLHFYSSSGFYNPKLLVVNVETNNAKEDGNGQEEDQQENNRGN